MDKISFAAAWGRQLQSTLLGLSSDVSQVEIEALRDALMSLAWQEGCPRAHRARSDEELAYRRQLISASPDQSYSALLITWPPGHVTPAHDHSQLWGIELVLDGALEVREFLSVESDAVELHPTRSRLLGAGDATAFIDPGYVHSCRNLSDTRPALSLHVYGGMLDDYRAFQPNSEGFYNVVKKRADRI